MLWSRPDRQRRGGALATFAVGKAMVCGAGNAGVVDGVDGVEKRRPAALQGARLRREGVVVAVQ